MPPRRWLSEIDPGPYLFNGKTHLHTVMIYMRVHLDTCECGASDQGTFLRLSNFCMASTYTISEGKMSSSSERQTMLAFALGEYENLVKNAIVRQIKTRPSTKSQPINERTCCFGTCSTPVAQPALARRLGGRMARHPTCGL